MTSLVMPNIRDKAYFLEISSDCHSLARGLVFNKSSSIYDRARKIWGDLNFYDQIENRHRVILLKEQPILNESDITCVSDIDDEYCFTFVTKELWDSKVLSILKMPPETVQLMNEQIKKLKMFKII
jgi:hypothetical protein